MTPCHGPALRNNILMMFVLSLAAAHMLLRVRNGRSAKTLTTFCIGWNLAVVMLDAVRFKMWGPFALIRPIWRSLLPIITDEYWYSQDLRINLMIKHSDPRKGITTMTVAQVTRTEPDPAFFEVPEG